MGDYVGDYHRVTKGDTRSSDNSSHILRLCMFMV